MGYLDKLLFISALIATLSLISCAMIGMPDGSPMSTMALSTVFSGNSNITQQSDNILLCSEKFYFCKRHKCYHTFCNDNDITCYEIIKESK